MIYLSDLLSFYSDHLPEMYSQIFEHLYLTFVSLSLTIIIGVGAGLFISRYKRFSGMVLGTAGVLQTIPSIALLGFMIPVLGIGPFPAIVALFLYSLLPVVRNTYTGILEVDPGVREAAKGMGMTDLQQLLKVEFPMALPVIIAGIRIAAVLNVGVATLAALIGSGGLGEFIFGGIALNNSVMILAGAIPAALLALTIDFVLKIIQNIKPAYITRVFIALAAGIIIFLIPSSFNSPEEKIKAGFTPEFLGRNDGLPLLKKVYPVEFNIRVLQSGLMYRAVKNSLVDVISGYTTDGRIKSYHLRVLEDSKQAFPPYEAVPLIRISTLNKFPWLEQTLNDLANEISNEEMTEMNFLVDEEKIPPEQVARDFLNKNNLIPDRINTEVGTLIIGSKIFTEQYILAWMFKLIIENSSDIRVSLKTGLGGTRICYNALRSGSIDLYPEYTGTSLSVLLGVDMPQIRNLQKKGEIQSFLNSEFRTEGLKWLSPLGFNNSYGLMMRKDHADSLSIRSVSDLAAFLSENNL